MLDAVCEFLAVRLFATPVAGGGLCWRLTPEVPLPSDAPKKKERDGQSVHEDFIKLITERAWSCGFRVAAC